MSDFIRNVVCVLELSFGMIYYSYKIFLPAVSYVGFKSYISVTLISTIPTVGFVFPFSFAQLLNFSNVSLDVMYFALPFI
jgi:hypothetical protein